MGNFLVHKNVAKGNENCSTENVATTSIESETDSDSEELTPSAYFFDLAKDAFVESEKEGNKIRYVNYRDDQNVYALHCAVDGEPRIGIYASEDIPPQSELFIDYGSDYDYDGLGIATLNH